MVEVRQTPIFRKLMQSLKDTKAAEIIARRIVRVQSGLMGDVKVLDGIGELRVDYGPGYRVYFVQHGNVLIVLLCGGDKGSQDRDIAKAKQLAKEI